MGRKLSNKLLDELVRGKYANILKVVTRDKELSLEIRNGKAIIYYQKGKILTLSDKPNKSNKCLELLSNGYYKEEYTPDAFKEEYSDELIEEHPEQYFEVAKSFINEYGPRRTEFTIQQLIASENASIDNDYLVIDMEYQYEQRNVPQNERIDFTRIDLLAIEKESKDIVLFELKQGVNSLKGDSGITEHIRKSKILIDDKRCANAIREDVKTIINQKVDLKLFPEEARNYIKEEANIKPMFIFVYFKNRERDEYDRILNQRVPTIYFNFSYVLKKTE